MLRGTAMVTLQEKEKETEKATAVTTDLASKSESELPKESGKEPESYSWESVSAKECSSEEHHSRERTEKPQAPQSVRRLEASLPPLRKQRLLFGIYRSFF